VNISNVPVAVFFNFTQNLITSFFHFETSDMMKKWLGDWGTLVPTINAENAVVRHVTSRHGCCYCLLWL
jgi:hypothetical protein